MIRLAMLVLAAAASATIALAQTAAPVRLFVFDGGILESDPGRYRLTKEDVGETRLSVACYLVTHPRGVLMWDTCAVPDAEWTPTGQPVAQRLVLADGAERRVTIQAPLEAQLKAAGRRPADVTLLALSHHHWDHTANANAFAGATWLVPPAEREAMFADKPAGTVRPATYARLRTSKSVPVTAAEHDVFGDGTVIIKSAPGHTAGHQVLYVKLAKTGGVLLSGDLYHYPQERTMNRYPTFEFNEEQTRASRAGVEAFMMRTGAQLWIQHDLTAHAKLRKAPQFYE
ncbi:MAG TPA: N-acyl homoserine lactonase family protein [Vicinamibacterales bacterium]|jgi:glyoxylase-like metal-dependent hydrolase (beta-lactamase superfamily II)|nr:N-acyl homoserine lactonase family protein [Vicinamibacterales bacterium]